MILEPLMQRGNQPWAPCPTATDLDEWHRYDIPRVGTFRIGPRITLFSVLGDTEYFASIWLYVELSMEEAAEGAARVFGDTKELMLTVEKYTTGKQALLALAVNLRLQYWKQITVADGQFHTLGWT